MQIYTIYIRSNGFDIHCGATWETAHANDWPPRVGKRLKYNYFGFNFQICFKVIINLMTILNKKLKVYIVYLL
jgi:hypothetical protein